MRNNYSEQLVALRGEKSQREIAEAVGIATSTYQMYENGKRVPSDSVKVRLSEYFGVSVQELFFSDSATYSGKIGDGDAKI